MGASRGERIERIIDRTLTGSASAAAERNWMPDGCGLQPSLSLKAARRFSLIGANQVRD